MPWECINIHGIQFNAYTVEFCLYTDRVTISLLGECTRKFLAICK